MTLKFLHILIAFMLNVQVSSDDGTERMTAWPRAVYAKPCIGSKKISISYEPGLPPEEANTYMLHIKKEFPKWSVIVLKFDTATSVTLEEKWFARITAKEDEENAFEIIFFKGRSYINLSVTGLVRGVFPYFKSVLINDKEYCNKPNVGYLDSYIVWNRNQAETPATNCGRRQVDHIELIVRGAPTKHGDWPWHVALYKLNRFSIKYICGGTLISKTTVLTAAHCTMSRGVPIVPEVLSVVLGKYHLIGDDIGTQERKVHQIIVHEKFNYTHLDNDIALLKLKTKVVFTDYIQPACLWYDEAKDKLPSKNVLGTIVGWGFDTNDSMSPRLNQASMPMVSESTCIKRRPLFYSTLLTENKFCAGHRNGTSACNGDSGSAFQVFIPDKANDTTKTNGAFFVRGIVSLTVSKFDVAICDPEYYVVFTDVSKYTKWIEDNM